MGPNGCNFPSGGVRGIRGDGRCPVTDEAMSEDGHCLVCRQVTAIKEESVG